MFFRANRRDNLLLLLILFIDNFGIYRNNYKVLKAFYWIPANLSYKKRKKIVNNFTLTLGPHGADVKDIINALTRPVRQLNKGISFIINNRELYICAFIIFFTRNLPSQANNAGFIRYNAVRGCRIYLCPSKK